MPSTKDLVLREAEALSVRDPASLVDAPMRLVCQLLAAPVKETWNVEVVTWLAGELAKATPPGLVLFAREVCRLVLIPEARAELAYRGDGPGAGKRKSYDAAATRLLPAVTKLRKVAGCDYDLFTAPTPAAGDEAQRRAYLETARRGMERFPFEGEYFRRGIFYAVALGESAEALAIHAAAPPNVITLADSLTVVHAPVLSYLAFAYVANDRALDGVRLLAPVLTKVAWDRETSATMIASVAMLFAGADQADDALRLLDRVVALQQLPWAHLDGQAVFGGLKQDPRYADLARKARVLEDARLTPDKALGMAPHALELSAEHAQVFRDLGVTTVAVAFKRRSAIVESDGGGDAIMALREALQHRGVDWMKFLEIIT